MIINDGYCYQCDYDIHLCGGCGEPLNHGQYSCAACKRYYGFDCKVGQTWGFNGKTYDIERIHYDSDQVTVLVHKGKMTWVTRIRFPFPHDAILMKGAPGETID